MPARLSEEWHCGEGLCNWSSDWAPAIAQHKKKHVPGAFDEMVKKRRRGRAPRSLKCPRCEEEATSLLRTINGRLVCPECRHRDVRLGARILPTDPPEIVALVKPRREERVEPTESELRDGCVPRNQKPKGETTRSLQELRGAPRQRHGKHHPLWAFRWQPIHAEHEAWFHSVIEARAQSQAQSFLEAYAGRTIKISDAGPALEDA